MGGPEWERLYVLVWGQELPCAIQVLELFLCTEYKITGNEEGLYVQ